MSTTEENLTDKTIVYCLGIYINPGMRNLLIEYLKRAVKKYKAVHVMFCYWWPGVDPEPFVAMVNSLGILNLKAWEFSIMASPAFGRRLGWSDASLLHSIRATFNEIGTMKKFFRKVDADVAHIILTEYQASFAFARAAALAKVPVRLLSFTGFAPTPARFRKIINRITDRCLTGVLLASSADEHGSSEYFPSTRKSVVHGWGLAPDLFRLDKVNPSRIRDELGISDDTPLIGTTTRIAPNKGQETLIRALPSVLKKYPELKCVILGGRYDKDQEYTGNLKALAEELDVHEHVLFLGERQDSADIFAAYDIAVHLADFDYLPFGVLECMALGKPCVVTDVGGLPDIIFSDINGIVVKSGDFNSAADGILKLLSDRWNRLSMGAKANETVKNMFNLDRLVDRVEKVYIDSLSGNLRETYGTLV